MGRVLLTHTDVNSGNPVYVFTKRITNSFKKNNSGTPNANYDGTIVPTRISGNVDVPKIVINGTLDTTNSTVGGITVLTQELLKEFIGVANTEADPVTLNIQYGNAVQWNSYQKVSSVRVNEIPITFSDVTVTLDSSDTVDASKPTFSITLEEVNVN
jgi:hypothetical protein